MNVDSKPYRKIKTDHNPMAPVRSKISSTSLRQRQASLGRVPNTSRVLSTYGQGMITDNHRVRTDQDLLEDFIRSDAKLNAQLTLRRRHHGTRMTDSMIVLDYAFDLELYNILSSKKDWEVSATLLSSFYEAHVHCRMRQGESPAVAS